jgi:tRNA nucleotidyltransferase (CCA-adding enzyme)
MRGLNTDMPEIEHHHIAQFATDKVNLPAAKAREHREQVNRLRDRLEAKIDEDPSFSLVKMLHAGSVAKGTGLKTINDLDTAVYVKKAEAPATDDRLVPWLADRLYEAAPPNMSRDQFEEEDHCVRVNFKGSGLNVDVVPVLYEDEPNDIGYLVNKRNGDRMLTSIPLHLKFIRDRKARYGSDFAQVIRLTKWWKLQAVANDPDFRLKSFMIELMWAHLADSGVDLSNYPSALESFFLCVVTTEFDDVITFTDFCSASEMPQRGIAPIEIIDPVNADNNVAIRYDDLSKKRILEASQDAFDAIAEAQYATAKGRAVDAWQVVLGPSFRG